MRSQQDALNSHVPVPLTTQPNPTCRGVFSVHSLVVGSSGACSQTGAPWLPVPTQSLARGHFISVGGDLSASGPVAATAATVAAADFPQGFPLISLMCLPPHVVRRTTIQRGRIA